MMGKASDPAIERPAERWIRQEKLYKAAGEKDKDTIDKLKEDKK